MPRIEEQSDGGYVKKLSSFERDLIKRIYTEVELRKNADKDILEQMEVLRKSVGDSEGITKALKIKIDDLQDKLNGLFASANSARIDRNLIVDGNIKANSIELLVTSGAAVLVHTRDLNPNFNAEFLQGKTPEDFVPKSHIGSRGVNAHGIVTPSESGFMSPAQNNKLAQFESADKYAMKATLDAHIGSGGKAHAEVSETEAGFMKPSHKKTVEEADDKYLHRSGGEMEGAIRFVKDENGLIFESTVNRGSDRARIYYVSDDLGPSAEDATLYIEAGNDGNGVSGPDRIVMRTVTEDNQPASQIDIETVKKDGTVAGGRINLNTETTWTPHMMADQFSFAAMRMTHVRMIGCGQDSPKITSTGLWVNNVFYPSVKRGWNVACFDRNTMQVEWIRGYDTHASDGGSNPNTEIANLTNDLNSLTDFKVVFIWTYDQPSFENGLAGFSNTQIEAATKALKRCGASNLVVNMKYRSSYAMVGIPGIGEGNSMEQYGYPEPVDLGTLLFNGNPIGLAQHSGSANSYPPEKVTVNVSGNMLVDTQTMTFQAKSTYPSPKTAIVTVMGNGGVIGTYTLNAAQTVIPIGYNGGGVGSHIQLNEIRLTSTGVNITYQNVCFQIGAGNNNHQTEGSVQVDFTY